MQAKEIVKLVEKLAVPILEKKGLEFVDVEYVKIELYDKIKAIERICKMLGFDAASEINVNTPKPMSVEEAKLLIKGL